MIHGVFLKIKKRRNKYSREKEKEKKKKKKKKKKTKKQKTKNGDQTLQIKDVTVSASQDSFLLDFPNQIMIEKRL